MSERLNILVHDCRKCRCYNEPLRISNVKP